MANRTYERYLEAEILNADPVKLVQLLFRGAIEAVAAARANLKAGLIRERSIQVVKAWSILHELTQSLDHQRGGDIAPALVRLYAYMQRRLLEANTTQTDPPLAEVESLLLTLNEGWQSVLQPPSQRAEEYSPISCSY